MTKPDYVVPENPLDLRTNKFVPKKIIVNRDGFVVASGNWENYTGDMLACRWHSKKDLGYPNGFGRPQWMLLGGYTESSLVKSPIHVFGGELLLKLAGGPGMDGQNYILGGWVNNGWDWHLVHGIDEESEILHVTGPGKRMSYTIKIDEVVETDFGDTLVGLWHSKYKGHGHVWCSPTGYLFVTYQNPKAPNVVEKRLLIKNVIDGKFHYADLCNKDFATFGHSYINCVHLGKLPSDRFGPDTSEINDLINAKLPLISGLYDGITEDLPRGTIPNNRNLPFTNFFDDCNIRHSEISQRDVSYNERFFYIE